MSFRDDIHQFTARLATRNRDIFTGTADECMRSIVEGSELTGAPGQPVGEYGPGYNNGRLGGTLKASWQQFNEGDDTIVIATNIEYAPFIEYGGNDRGEFQLRSSVGGFHSVDLTVSGFDRIVANVTARVAAKGG